VTFWKCSDIFSKILHIIELIRFSGMLWIDGNELLSHLLTEILQTLHSCYGHIEDVHLTFWKCSDIFLKIYKQLILVISPACFE
jgi:hypothetical protein